MITLTYTPKTQVCSCCGLEKPLTEFYTQSYTGLPSGQCKLCTNIKRSVERKKAGVGKFVSKEKQRHMSEISYTVHDWKAAMLHFGGTCVYCGCGEGRGKKTSFDKEHLIPVSRGGKTVANNIAPACKKCNRGRGNKPLFQWFRAQAFWRKEKEDKIVEWMGLETAREEGYK